MLTMTGHINCTEFNVPLFPRTCRTVVVNQITTHTAELSTTCICFFGTSEKLPRSRSLDTVNIHIVGMCQLIGIIDRAPTIFLTSLFHLCVQQFTVVAQTLASDVSLL